METDKKFTLEELKQFDGVDDKPAYVVLAGQVFDVSASKLWHQGRHMGSHRAGSDMTQEIIAAPHGPEKIDSFQKVGSLIASDGGKEKIPPFLARLFHTVPLLRQPSPSHAGALSHSLNDGHHRFYHIVSFDWKLIL